MEQTALRPKPMPGRDTPRPRTPGGDRSRRSHAVRRRRRRLLTLVVGLTAATGLVLSGVGLGTVSATVIGMSKLADMQKSAGAPPGAGAGAKAPGKPGQQAPGAVPGGAQDDAAHKDGKGPDEGKGGDHEPATLGVEAVDAADGKGALLVGVHMPGPGYTAGLVRGDTVIRFGKKEITSAADLVRAVAGARPGKRVQLMVRHENGLRQPLSGIPGVMT